MQATHHLKTTMRKIRFTLDPMRRQPHTHPSPTLTDTCAYLACGIMNLCVWHLEFGMWQLPFAICHLPFAICHSPFAICHLPFAICHLPFAICHLPVCALSVCAFCAFAYWHCCCRVCWDKKRVTHGWHSLDFDRLEWISKPPDFLCVAFALLTHHPSQCLLLATSQCLLNFGHNSSRTGYTCTNA